MNAREAVLDRIRRGVGRGKADEGSARAAVAARLAARGRCAPPARIALDREAPVDLFAGKARTADATVSFVARAADAPEAVADYLRGRNLPAEAAVAPHPDLDAMDWRARALAVHRRAPSETDRVGVNRAFGAVAETGTLVMASGPESPATMNFLPETHIAVVRASEIAGACEDVWDRLRAAAGDGAMPRTVNMITGPSRTGDIEQTLQTGVHGPKHLHIVVVRED